MISILAVIYVVFISLGLPDSLFGVAWPVLHLEFEIAESFASIYSIITGICTGGAGFVAGIVIRKFGTPLVTLFSTLLTAIGLIGISFAPNIVVMMIFTVVLGYGAGAIDTALNNFVSLHYTARHMNWLHCFWGVGVTISPLILSSFLGGGEGEWRNGYRIIALMQLLVAVIVIFSLKKWREKDKVLSVEVQLDEPNEKINFLKIKGVITSILSLGLYCSMEFLIGTWGATYLVNIYLLSPDMAAKWVSFYYGGIMIGRFVSGIISSKVTDNTLVRGGITVSFLGIIMLLLPLGELSVLGLLLIGFGFGPVFPSVLHLVPERFGQKYSADLTGFHMTGAYGIGYLTQITFGYTAAATTFKITPFVLLVFIVALILVNEKTIKSVKRGN